MVKIFQTADLHLDSPFSSLSPSMGEKRREEARNVFLNMMQYAADEQFDLVLIPGDLFDSNIVSRDTVDLLLRGFEKLSCPVIISPGNHDPYTPDSIYATEKFPPNVYIFKDETPCHFDFPKNYCSVWGSAFTRDKYENTVLAKIPELDDGTVHILCQHGDTRIPNTKCPLRVNDIAYKGFTYAALGHIHVPEPPVSVGKATVAYSGCPIGRSFDEPGFGYALSVIIDNNRRVQITKIRFADSRYAIEHLDVSGLSDDREIAAKIKFLIGSKGYSHETSLRVILEGEVPTDFTPACKALEKLCIGELAALDIKNRVMPCLDASYLENDLTLRGAFYRVLADRLSSDDENERILASEALRLGLAAMDNRVLYPDDRSILSDSSEGGNTI